MRRLEDERRCGTQPECRVLVEAFREMREALGLSLSALERLTGISRQALAAMERGRNMPSIEVLMRVALACEFPLVEIVVPALRRRARAGAVRFSWRAKRCSPRLARPAFNHLPTSPPRRSMARTSLAPR